MSIKIALAGNPNCGKTTLFNNLTGSNQYVGNWPGVTVEKKEGKLKGDKDVIIQDLPGIYSLSPYTLEEVVSRTYLVKEKPDAILNIIDGTNIERNLYLTTQLIELGIPVVMAVNMIDLVRKNGDKIDLKKLSAELGCEAVEISALKGEGTEAAAKAAVTAAQGKKAGELPHVFTGSVEHAIAHIEESIQGKVDDRFLRWYAVKLFERDDKVMEELTEGEVRKGRVTSLADFGAFVNIGGADGLVHMTEIAWDRLVNPSEVLKVGEEVKVKVISVDRERRRIGLSIRQLQGDPWLEQVKNLKTGQLVEGKITRLTSFGAFARLNLPGDLEGLIHISELSDRRVEHPKEVVKVGDTVTMRILKIEDEDHRIGLSMRRVDSLAYVDSDWKSLAADFDLTPSAEGATIATMLGKEAPAETAESAEEVTEAVEEAAESAEEVKEAVEEAAETVEPKADEEPKEN